MNSAVWLVQTKITHARNLETPTCTIETVDTILAVSLCENIAELVSLFGVHTYGYTHTHLTLYA